MRVIVKEAHRRDVKKIGGDQSYSGNDNRTFCKENGIEESFTQKGRTRKNEVKNSLSENLQESGPRDGGSFWNQKEYYGPRMITARIKLTEIQLSSSVSIL